MPASVFGRISSYARGFTRRGCWWRKIARRATDASGSSVEQILPPLIVALTQQPHQVPAGVQAEWTRGPRQAHPGFIRSPVPLAIVAGMATSNQILPGGFSLARARHYMIQRQLIRAECTHAVLAGITVAHQNVFAGQGPG